MKVHEAKSRAGLGQFAGHEIGEALRDALRNRTNVRLILAAAPSQYDMLAALRREPNIDWSRITAFHMDEYIGLPADSPQGFANWLKREFVDHLPFIRFERITPGNNPETACQRYAALLAEDPADVVLLGIGTNGHLAFNDPPRTSMTLFPSRSLRWIRCVASSKFSMAAFPRSTPCRTAQSRLQSPRSLLVADSSAACLAGIRAPRCGLRSSRLLAGIARRPPCAPTPGAPFISIMSRARCLRSMSIRTITGRDPQSWRFSK